jgi:CheY-like chemotaxis protein
LYNVTTIGHLDDVFKIKITSSNVISCSSSSNYDELITKLQLQAITEYEHRIQNWDLKIQEEVLCNQKRRRILIVDDEPDTCMSFQTVLEDAGFECKSYTDPVKALQEFRPNYYDLILLDVKMPVLNGFELCKKITEVDNTPHVSFITASEEYYEKSRNKYYRELVNNNTNNNSKISYLQTPIGNKELVQIVNMIMTSRDII